MKDILDWSPSRRDVNASCIVIAIFHLTSSRYLAVIASLSIKTIDLICGKFKVSYSHHWFDSGEKISANEAEKRCKQYARENLGNFIYYGIKDVYGKSVW